METQEQESRDSGHMAMKGKSRGLGAGGDVCPETRLLTFSPTKSAIGMEARRGGARSDAGAWVPIRSLLLSLLSIGVSFWVVGFNMRFLRGMRVRSGPGIESSLLPQGPGCSIAAGCERQLKPWTDWIYSGGDSGTFFASTILNRRAGSELEL